MKLRITFLLCIVGLLRVGFGVPRKRDTDHVNGRTSRNSIKSLYRRPVHDDEVDQNSAKQRREVRSVQKRSCTGNHFQCDDDEFIPCEYFCDYYIDCANRADETNCPCTEGFRCGDNYCIPEEWRCDDEPDCLDYSDEGAECGCNGNQFQCDDDEFIPCHLLCDYYFDCANRADEINCPCTEDSEFLCGDGYCIPEQWKCDDEPDCLDQSDEGAECEKTEFTCDGLSLQPNQVCDHEWNCESGIDEFTGDCESMSLGTTVTIASQNYPSTYPNDLTQTWTFVADEGFGLTFSISDFGTEAGYDLLSVGRGEIPDELNAVKDFSGTEQEDFTTTGTTLWVRFNSDKSNGGKGFQGVVTVVDLCSSTALQSSPFRCNHLLECPGGVDEEDCPTLSEAFSFSTPAYPNMYENNLDIYWVFFAEEGQNLTFRCLDLDTQADHDWLHVGNGRVPDQETATKLTGSACLNVTSRGNSMWIHFHSDYTNGLKGFRGTVFVTGTQQVDTSETADLVDFCGYNNYIVETRIINGVDSNIEKWPWQVMLLKKWKSYPYSHYFKCGGTLISDRHVLTAAHCFDPGDLAGDFQIALGRNHTSLSITEGVRRNVVHLAIHEGFSESTYEHDVAVLTLDEPVKIPNSRQELQNKFSINKACVDHSKNHWNENSDCFITGYGVINESTNTRDELLQEAEVTYMNHVDCEASSRFQDRGEILPSMICGGAVDGSDSCQGDSGGPLVCRHSQLKYYVVGITSWGYGCGRSGWPGVYASVADHYEWIMNKML